MSVRVGVVAVSLFLAAGCERGDQVPAWPPFEMAVPDDVPDQITVIDKDGTKHDANGKELWSDGYRSGWKRCVYDFEHGHLDLAVEKPEPPPLGHYIIVVRGWNTGYLTCWRAIRQAKKAAEPGATDGTVK
jgi:hypothetical protein